LEFKFGFWTEDTTCNRLNKKFLLKKRSLKLEFTTKNSDQNLCTYLQARCVNAFSLNNNKKNNNRRIFVLLSVDENQRCFLELDNSTQPGLFSISLNIFNTLKLANLSV